MKSITRLPLTSWSIRCCTSVIAGHLWRFDQKIQQLEVSDKAPWHGA
jgi:hypothetical protein